MSSPLATATGADSAAMGQDEEDTTKFMGEEMESTSLYGVERKKPRLVDRFSDELLREICGKKIDAGSLSLSSLRRRNHRPSVDRRTE